MKVITQITWQHIKNNKRTSLSVMVAVLLSATMLCGFCFFGYSFWNAAVGMARTTSGNWHGELYADTPGEKLPYIEENPGVEAVMIKGDWQAVQLPAGTAMPYLFLRDVNQSYWQNMSEKNTLLEGRLPSQNGEVAVSKLFFERNPQFAIGDTLTLPVGQRTLDGEALPIQSIRREGETFNPTGELALTVVGKLDLTTTTAYPGYYALGYLERQDIRPNDMLTVYLRFTNMRDTYEILPEIAEHVGYEKDEFGEYPLRYNTSLLGFYGINDGKGTASLQNIVIGAMVGLVVVLLVVTFSLIIGSVFSLSANARVRQLGLLRSVGASPGQIRASILTEGLWLSALPLALSVLLGYLFSTVMGRSFASMMRELLDFPLEFRFSPVVALLGVLVSLATVLAAISSTARKMGRLTPIEAVRGTKRQNVKKHREKKHPLVRRLFGYPGALARDNLAAYRKAFRMPVAALCISFVLVAGTLSMIGMMVANNKASYEEEYFDVNILLYLSQERDDEMIEEVRALPGVQESAVTSHAKFGLPATADMQSDEFTAVGGFAAVDTNLYSVVERNGGWRIQGNLLGMDSASFTRYCESIGAQAEDYLNAEQPLAIAVNTLWVNPNGHTEEERGQTMPFLNLNVGDTYTLAEQATDSINSSHTFEVEIGAVTQVQPPVDAVFSNYQLLLVVPFSQYDAIVADFMPERALQYRYTDILLRTTLPGLTAEAQLGAICSRYLGSEDYHQVNSLDGELQREGVMYDAILSANNGIALLFALIGISNAFSTVAGNLAMRRCDFAMLRSVGLDNSGFRRVLVVEGLSFALRPLLLAIPWVAGLCLLFAWLLDMSLPMLWQAIPLGSILAYGAVIIAAMALAYVYGARNISRDDIADVLRSELA